MKFLHTADLHIGKIVHEISMIPDQIEILQQIQQIAFEEKVDAVVIAGDIYDRVVPPKEAVTVLDKWMTSLNEKGIIVLAISGNHDSPERLSFANEILCRQGLYVVGTFDGNLKRVTLFDTFGAIDFYLMPFLKPAQVRSLYGDCEIENCQQAVDAVLEKNPMVMERRNVLIAHQFVVDGGWEPKRSDSETHLCAGGLEQVEAASLRGFDYVALGHIHRSQQIGENRIYYAGSPLKYSFSETDQDKSVMIVTIGEKGKKQRCSIQITYRELHPLRDMRQIRGKLENLLEREIVESQNRMDYLSVELTDEEELLDPVQTLRSVYPNVMQLTFEKNRRIEQNRILPTLEIHEKSPTELFEEFFYLASGRKVDEERMKVMEKAFEEWKEKRGES